MSRSVITKAALRRLFDERSLHRIFQVGLLLKAVFAVGEVAGGAVSWFVSPRTWAGLAAVITQGELSEDPHDFVATHLVRWAQHLSVGAQHFAAVYLVSHGAIKLALIVGLLREKLWFYPAAILVFGLFIVYQLYRYSFTGSVLLLLITVIDVVVIALTWHEYRFLGRRRAVAGN
ncbi:MAG: DUF2127 domain-containing protein [Gammaproteobacteria bacterium]|nr:DUF2127 domain-containing protein [Gammaproteobacteria bacterium]